MFTAWAERFRVVGDAAHLKILRLPAVRDACVGESVERLPVSQPTVSRHLRQLRHAGLVEQYRRKSRTDYRRRADVPSEITALLKELPGDADDVV